ncbi:MAG TPA: MotA/TolQ/ExbB proton channel family protein, partial [Chryseolinea sp.]|nr:MotA/TolQ/ExbB proton channel family protein [Chryseolinea sp.]
MIFLQIVSDTVTGGGQQARQSLSVIDVMIRGGFMMLPIIALLGVLIYFFIERIRLITQANQDPTTFMTSVKELVLKGDIATAKSLCTETNTPVALMIEQGIARLGRPLKHIETSMENTAKAEIFKLEKNIAVVATIGGVAPMIGFLGTVIGMVKGYSAIAHDEGVVSPKLLSAGIYESLITTIAGLVVGIV